MGRFLRTPLDVERAVAAAAPLSLDLPVNPLSAIKITLDFLDSGAATVNKANGFAALRTVSNVDIQFKGSSIINGSLQDLAVLSALLGNGMPSSDVHLVAATDRSRVSVTIPFGRRVFWQRECFPATRRGEFKIILTLADVDGTIDLQTIHMETLELFDATPTQFLKYTTTTKTPSATGDHDTDLPLGNPILGILLFGTTAPSPTAITASIRRLRLLIDNVEQYYNDARWASFHSDLMHRLGRMNFDDHVHTENLAAAYAAGVATNNAAYDLASAAAFAGIRQYAYLDFDPLADESYLLETEGRGRVHLKINADVANAIRILPVELIRLAAPAA